MIITEGKIKIVSLLIAVIVLMSSVTACYFQKLPVKVQNQTDVALRIYIDNSFIGEVEPGKEIKNKIVPGGFDSYEILGFLNKIIVYEKTFTGEELKDLDYIVVIQNLE